ncbi:MAG: hypothetical protein NTZ35_05765 [Ignavibacteriales bacterium]|nr:hypothetical protein [Ignavibacteriales bacterium]
MRILALSLIAVMIMFARPQKVAAQELAFPQVEGWRLAQEETVYNPNNLFDVIDGAADLYLEYDFVDLHIGRYAKDELEIKVEIYKHGSSVDAFGIFSQERFADYHFIDLGVQGYLEKGALNFLSGVYYIKISTIQEGSGAQDAMLLIARAVEKHLQQNKAWPKMLAAFPVEKKKAYSEQYVAKSFLGYSPLNCVFVASYDEGSSFKAYVIKFATPQDALKTLASFENALPANANRKEIGGKQEIQDPNNGLIELVQKGNYIFGVVSTEVGRNHDTFLNELEKKLLSVK